MESLGSPFFLRYIFLREKLPKKSKGIFINTTFAINAPHASERDFRGSYILQKEKHYKIPFTNI
jgi:hypothetical protein